MLYSIPSAINILIRFLKFMLVSQLTLLSDYMFRMFYTRSTKIIVRENPYLTDTLIRSIEKICVMKTAQM